MSGGSDGARVGETWPITKTRTMGVVALVNWATFWISLENLRAQLVVFRRRVFM